MANPLDPYACGPQCCEPEKCDKDPLEILVTNGEPQGKPDPCDHLPIAYDAANGCFYLWHENSGWFEASGVRIQHNNTDTAGSGDSWAIEVCEAAITIYNSRNTAFDLIELGNDVAGFPQHLRLTQTYGPTFDVDLSSLDSWVTALSIVQNGDDYSLRLTQSAGRPTLTVPLPDWLFSVSTDESIDGDGTPDDPLSVNWDDLCPNAETLTVLPDSARIIICANGAVKAVTPETLLDDMCFSIPDLGVQCGVAEQLVAVRDEDDPTCFRLARYNRATTQITAFGSNSVHGASHNIQLPLTPDTPASYYDYYTLSADVDAGTVNGALLAATKVAEETFTLACNGAYELNFRSLTVFDPPANGGAGADSRVVIRINGVFELSATDLIVNAFGPFTNFEASIDQTLIRNLTAGTYTFEVYVVRNNKAQAAQLALTSTPVPGGVSRSNTFTVRKAVS